MSDKKENKLRVEREEILELLPHRGTFQLIDALENLNGEDSCTGIFKVLKMRSGCLTIFHHIQFCQVF